MGRAAILGIAAAALASQGCATAQLYRRFSDAPVLWEDDDRHLIDAPQKYWSPLYWDTLELSIFRPLSHTFLLERGGKAKNVNALEEVPNSSWYTNRLALRQLTPEEVVEGPCIGPGRLVDPVWTVLSGKVDGTSPGFVARNETNGELYLLKFDNFSEQKELPTGADVIGSKIYWAAGFNTPCNEVIFIDPATLKISPDATKKDLVGRKTPLTREDVTTAMLGSSDNTEGNNTKGPIRGAASRFLPGQTLGPFKYHGVRADDPNDVIPHEDRRELRGSRLLAAWLNHFDAREQNTMTTFKALEGSGKGYVVHNIIDWSDSLGLMWDFDQMSRRFGHSYYLDFKDVLTDLATLGFMERPWDRAERRDGPTHIFGYYRTEDFEPEQWKDGYPNPAFDRMDDGDAYWAAKIISRFSDAHIERLVAEAKLTSPEVNDYLERTLKERRDRIVEFYLNRTTALDRPRTRGHVVCFDDLLVVGGYEKQSDTEYSFRLGQGPWRPATSVDQDAVCYELPNGTLATDYLLLEGRTQRTGQQQPAKAARFHFSVGDDETIRLVGIER